MKNKFVDILLKRLTKKDNEINVALASVKRVVNAANYLITKNMKLYSQIFIHLMVPLLGGVISYAETVEVELEVIKKKEQMVDGKKVTTMQVTPPDLANLSTHQKVVSVDSIAATLPTSPIAQPPAGLPGQFLHLISDTYDGRYSKLSWTHKGEPYEAWSNLDFTLLSGFTSFRSKGKNVTFMHMCSARNSETGNALPEGSPRWLKRFPSATEKPKFRIIKGDKENREAIHPIRTLHRLYAREHDALIRSKEERSDYYQEVETKRKAQKAEDIEVFYWKKKTSESGKERK